MYDICVHANIGNMNPSLCLWKSKIVITEIFVLCFCTTPSLTSPRFQSVSLNPACVILVTVTLTVFLN